MKTYDPLGLVKEESTPVEYDPLGLMKKPEEKSFTQKAGSILQTIKEKAKENLKRKLDLQIGAVEAAGALGTGITSAVGGLGAGLVAEGVTAAGKNFGLEGYEHLDPAEAFTTTKEEIGKAAYQPRTEMGKTLTTPVEMPQPGDYSPNALLKTLDPRRLIGAPGEVGEELFEMPAESWNAPEWLRQPGKDITAFAMYPGVGKGFKGVKNLVREVMAERAKKRADVLPEVAKVEKPKKAKEVKPYDPLDIVKEEKKAAETSEEIAARIQEELKLKKEPVEEVKTEKPVEPVWKKMPEEELRKQAEHGVEGAKEELAVREAKGKEIIEPTEEAKRAEELEAAEKEAFERELVEQEIPELKSTEEAIAFGKKATPEQVTELERLYKESQVKSKSLRDEGKLQEALDEGVHGQFLREATDKAKGVLPEKPKKVLVSSGFEPTDSLFNNPKVASNTTYAWRSMGEKEFTKLVEGEKEYSGDKAATKGNFLAGIPESAGQFGGKGKYLVEFGDIKVLGDEGLRKGSKATRDNITKVWRFNNRTKAWEVVKDWEAGVVKKSVELKLKTKEKKVTKTEVKVEDKAEEASIKLYDEITTLDNKLTEAYDNKNSKLIVLKDKILEAKEPYKTVEGYYKNISLAVKDAIKGFEEEIKLLERTENNKIRQLQKKITEVEKKIDKVEEINPERSKIDLAAEKEVKVKKSELPELLKDKVVDEKENAKVISKTKDTIKEKRASSEIAADAPIRFTNVVEVNHMLKTGENFLGKDSEGNLGISASTIPEEFGIVAYGSKTKTPVAIVYPKEAIEGTGTHPNEVKINPAVKLNKLKFIVGDHAKLLTLEELRAAAPKVSKKVREAEKAGRATEAEKYIVELEMPRSIAAIVTDLNKSLGERGAIGKQKLTAEQKAARGRIKADFAQLKKVAKERGQNFQSFLEELGFDAKTIKYYAKETPQDRIDTLKETLLNRGAMTEELYQDAIKSIRIKAPKKEGREAFLSKSQEKRLTTKLLKLAPVAEMKSTTAKGLAEMPAVKEVVDSLTTHFKKGQKGLALKNIKTESTLDMHHFADSMQKQTGKDFGTLFDALVHEKHKTEYRLDREIEKIAAAGGKDFLIISKDPIALERINNYIASNLPQYVKGKPTKPKNITEAEKRIAEAMIDGFKRMEGAVRYNRFHEWREHGTVIPNAPVADLKRANEIYMTKGDAALKTWLEGKTWGVKASGYDAGIVINPTIKRIEMKPEFGKRGLRASKTMQFQKYKKDILRRYASYMRQMTNRTELKPLTDAWVELFEVNKDKFADPQKMAELLTRNLREILGQKEKPQVFEELFIRAYSQAARAIFLDVRKGVRNRFQNIAFYTNFMDAMKKAKLTPAEQRYFDTYISQMRGIQRDWLYQDYEGLPGLSKLNKWADQINVMGRSDTTNRMAAFRMKLGAVKTAIKKHPEYKTNPAELNAVIKESGWGSIEAMERKHALELLARKGEDAMIRYVASAVVKKVHYLYERFQRSPAEQGTELARVVSNLLTFRKGYVQRAVLDIRKLRKSEKEIEAPIGGRKEAIKSISGTLIMGAIASWFYTKLTGDERMPYAPLKIITDLSLGGLATGMQEQIGDFTADTMSAITGDKAALGRAINGITRAGDSFIPFYNEAMYVIEGFSDYKDVDKAVLRQLRSAMDDRYKAKPMGYYKKQRDLIEAGQHIVFGTDKEKEKAVSTKMKSLKTLRKEGKSKNALRERKSLKALREG